METQKQAHPTAGELAAFALKRLKPDKQAQLQEHVSACGQCTKFLQNNPPDKLAARLRQLAASRLSQQSTPGIGEGGTLASVPRAANHPANAAADPPAVGKLPPAPAAGKPAVSRDPAKPLPIAKPIALRSAASPKAPGSPAAIKSVPGKHNDIPADLRQQDRYEIVRKIGEGGMGSVFEGFHKLMKRRVAIKTINASISGHPDALKRFLREVEAAAKLSHPNIAQAYDADKFGASHVLISEFVDGESLDKVIDEGGSLTVAQACEYVQQAARGLQNALEHGLAHRDIKPSNLMLTPAGTVKILDFGLAKIRGAERESAGLTGMDRGMGTAQYMAPEQALDAANADIRADIYALGCTLYCLLTGAPPWEGDVVSVLTSHQRDIPQPACELRPDVQKPLSDFIDRMLAKSPADRPQTPSEVVKLLESFVAKTEAPAKPAAFDTPGPAADEFAFALDRAPAPVAKGGTRAVTRVAPCPGLIAALVSAKRPPWVWPVVGGGAAALLVVIVFVALGVFKARTPEGTIVIENVPADAEVLVDGNEVKLTRAGDTVTITAVGQGTHELRVEKVGAQVWAQKVDIAVAGERVIARFEANAADPKVEGPVQPSPAPGAPVASHPVVATEGNPRTRSIDMLEIIDPVRDAVAGTWTLHDGALRNSGMNVDKIEFPYVPPEEYDFEVTFIRPAGKNVVRQVCCAGGHRFLWCVGNQNYCWLDLGKKATHGIAGYYKRTLHDQARINTRVEVRGTAIATYINGVLIGRCNIDGQEVSQDVHDVHRLPRDNSIGITVGQEPAIIEGVCVTEISGSGNLLRGRRQYAPLVPADPAARLARVYGGQWQCAGDELMQTKTDSELSALSFGDYGWRDLDLSLEVFTPDVAGEGVFVSFNVPQDEFKFRSLRLGVVNRELHHITDLNNGKIVLQKAEDLLPDWHKVEVKLRGSRCECRVDGVLQFESHDDPAFVGGCIGLGTYKTAGRFRNIVVKSGGGTGDLWTGLPTIPAEFAPLPGMPENAAAPARAAPPKAVADDGFVPLFNGKDLTGWETHAAQPGDWQVKDGLLVGRGGLSYLYSKRDDLQNVHVRLKARVTAGGNSGVIVRSTYGIKAGSNAPHGYEAAIEDGRVDVGTGGLYIIEDGVVRVKSEGSSFAPGKFFTLEVIAQGNDIEVKVNGWTTAKYTAQDAHGPGGRLALQCHNAKTVIEFESIEIKPLDAKADQAQGDHPADAKRFGGRFYKFFAESHSWHEACRRCVALGGRLAIVNSGAENDFLTELVREQGKPAGRDTAWLGATDELDEGVWKWVDGQGMNYINWDLEFKQPNNKDKIEHYLVLWLRNNGKWSDQSNVSKQFNPGFICQWEK